jgi:hypothetical protein
MSQPTFEKFRTPACNCPHCGYLIDGATHAGGEEGPVNHPEPGDVAICLRCVRLSRYGDDLQLIALTDEQMDALPAEVKHDLARAQAALGITAARYPNFRPK